MKMFKRIMLSILIAGNAGSAAFGMEKIADLDVKTDDGLRQAVERLCELRVNPQEIAAILLEKGFDVNGLNEDGDTPLTDASMNGYPDLVSLFLKAGAGVDARNRDGLTPLFAITMGIGGIVALESALLLLKAGANVNATDDGDTVLMRFVTNRGSTSEPWSMEFIRLLVEAGVDVDARNCKGETVFQLANVQGLALCIKRILHNEFDNTPAYRRIATGIGDSNVPYRRPFTFEYNNHKITPIFF